MTYQEKYQKLIEELNKLETKLYDEQKEYREKKEKLEDASIDKTFIEDDLMDLKEENTYMIESKKERISNIFGYVYTSLLALTCIASCAIGLYCIAENISISNLLMTCCITITLELVISNIIERIVKKKIIKKIENSDKYNDIITEIKEKEEELERLKDFIPHLAKEVTIIESKLNMTQNAKEEITRQLITLKDEVFSKAKGISLDEPEKNSPLTKIRTK